MAASLTSPDLVVLALLLEQPRHGYQVNQELERRDVQDWAAVSRPQVYYSLRKLGSAGLIRAASRQEPSLGPDRLTYEVTSKGRTALVNALARESWCDKRPPPPFLTWLALSIHAPARTLREQVRRRRRFLESEIEREAATLEAVRRASGKGAVVAELMIGLTLRQFDTELRWLDEVEERLGIRRKRR